MQKVIQKSLKMTIIQEISELNRNNIEFYALLRKLEEFNNLNGQAVNQRLETIRLDIREKIKALASNIDLLYQTFDKKISIILGYVNQFTGKDTTKLEQQIASYQSQIKELQDKNNFLLSRYETINSQNEQLKQKNILLISELDNLSKRGITTNDSNQSDNKSRQYSKKQHEDTVSLEHRLSSNELTFNQKNQKKNKTIRSEENSFSSILIKEQNSFEPNIKPVQSSTKLMFGCLPKKKEQSQGYSHNNLATYQQNNGNYGGINIKNQKNILGSREEQPQHKNQHHRMQFLINNLREAHETTLTSERSFMRGHNQEPSQEKSVLSRGVVKKYMI